MVHFTAAISIMQLLVMLISLGCVFILDRQPAEIIITLAARQTKILVVLLIITQIALIPLAIFVLGLLVTLIFQTSDNLKVLLSMYGAIILPMMVLWDIFI